MNFYYYTKKIDNNHKIFLKTNNEINFNCRKEYNYTNSYLNNIKLNINCNENKTFLILIL